MSVKGSGSKWRKKKTLGPNEEIGISCYSLFEEERSMSGDVMPFDLSHCVPFINITIYTFFNMTCSAYVSMQKYAAAGYEQFQWKTFAGHTWNISLTSVGSEIHSWN